MNSAEGENLRASQAIDKSIEGVETTWEVNLLNNRQERPTLSLLYRYGDEIVQKQKLKIP